jgi:hypothetical protein
MQAMRRHRAIRLLAANAAGGGVFGAAAVGVLIVADVAGLATLMARADDGGTALALLTAGFVTTFAAAAASTAIMLIPRDADEPEGGGGRLQPVPVTACGGRRSVHGRGG